MSAGSIKRQQIAERKRLLRATRVLRRQADDDRQRDRADDRESLWDGVEHTVSTEQDVWGGDELRGFWNEVNRELSPKDSRSRKWYERQLDHLARVDWTIVDMWP